MNVFITGMAGMIGFHLAQKLQAAGHRVYGIDNFNNYYEPQLKHDRDAILAKKGLVTHVGDICDINFDALFKSAGTPDVVVHLAAYANPRHSMVSPWDYINTNIGGTQKLIEACERNGIDKVVYASSSCVMHGQPLPWNETDRPGLQNNPYGWSKRSNECQFGHSKIEKTIGLRFFTVYGPYGRPDMALFLFTKGIIDGTPIIAYNNGNMIRDFTYVDDIVQGVEIVVNHTNVMPKSHEIFNIGFGQQVQLMDFISNIENVVGRKAIIDYRPAHPADVPATWSDTSKLQALGYKPTTPTSEGIEHFIKWYRGYYNV